MCWVLKCRKSCGDLGSFCPHGVSMYKSSQTRRKESAIRAIIVMCPPSTKSLKKEEIA